MNIMFKSTRGDKNYVTASQAIVQGIANDGGLFVPETIPTIDFPLEKITEMSYQELAYEVLKLILTDYTEEEFDKISNLNIKSVYTCSKVCIPYLKESHGVILNTSSMVSIYGQPSGIMYPASKYAVNGITKSLARELAPYGIRVNAVAPGITNTDMVKSLPKELIEQLIKTIPLGRIGEPEDIANAFLFIFIPAHDILLFHAS